MTKYIVQGGSPLFGEVHISGAKNAAVPIIPAALMVDGVCRIENIPQISDVTLILQILRELGADITGDPHMDIREYIRDMADCLAAADLVICRAGASTISELTALGVPAVIVPSPYVTNNHQEKNARVLENAGGAAVLLEKDCSGQALFQAACGILHDGARRASMERAMSALGIRDATERIYQTVLEICQ